MPILFSMEPGTKMIPTPVKNKPYADLAALRSAIAALSTTAAVINTRVQINTPALTQQQLDSIADGVATAVYQLEAIRKFLGI